MKSELLNEEGISYYKVLSRRHLEVVVGSTHTYQRGGKMLQAINVAECMKEPILACMFGNFGTW